MTVTTREPKSILLIDDDEFIAGTLHDYLVSRGLRVDVALDAASAEKRMKERRYQTILVDPYLTGGVRDADTMLIDTIRLLQAGTSVVILTGYGSEVLQAAAADASMTVLLKPQSITYLSELLAG